MIELMDALADAQQKLGVEFRMRGFIKSQLFTDAQAEAMHRAGFRWILVGFESGSPRILENINKKATREENTRCMEIAKRHGLKVKALMSMGHPGESEQTVQESKDWLLEVKPDDFDMTVITTYPGTPYFDWAVQTAPDVWTYTYPKNGDRLHAYDVEFTEEAGYYKGRPGEYSSFVFTDHLSADDLVRLRDGLEADVRAQLNIPFNQSAAALKYEHSMGQGLPDYILRKTNANRVPVLK
jgi:coproporphyrinogen III oxidase-like Fe-S oxidoreductase